MTAWLPTVRCSSSIDDTPVVAERGDGCGTRWRSDAACATCRCERSGFTGLMRTSHCRGDRWNSESAGHAQPILPPQGRQVKRVIRRYLQATLAVDGSRSTQPPPLKCLAAHAASRLAQPLVAFGRVANHLLEIRATAGGGGTGR